MVILRALILPTKRMGSNPDAESFWDHLEELRGRFIRIVVAVVGLAIVAFVLKEELFSVAFAPCRDDFITYRLFGTGEFHINLINVAITEQFIVHVKTSVYAGLMVASPYILYQLFCFVSPALYERELHYATRFVCLALVMFLIGTAVNYFAVFPFTLRFLATYQVSESVVCMLSVSSYMDTLLSMNLIMGLIFELPVACWLLARLGLLRYERMKRYRRHAVVIVLLLSAVVTPTTDAFTLFVVAIPIWLLFEVSMLIVKMV